MPAFLGLTLAAAVGWRIFHSPDTVKAQRTVPAMGTLANFTIVCHEDEADAILSSMDSLVRSVEWELDPDGTGPVAMLANAGSAGVTPHLAHLLALADSLEGPCRGAFDPGIAPLIDLWGFSTGSPSLPAPAAIDSALQLCGMDRFEVSGDSIRALTPGASLDFGAVAPGYASDLACELAMRRGAQAALVEIGGEIRCEGAEWRIAIRNPRGDGFREVLEIEDGGVSTSGDYESFFIQEGVRYCHILVPSTGMPENGVASVTVLADRADIADAVSTALAVGGPELYRALPESLVRGAVFVLESDSGLVEVRCGDI